MENDFNLEELDEEFENDLERFNIPSIKSLEEEKQADDIERWLESLETNATLEEENRGMKL